jgi:16S rRNA (guanine527-N7)-methyltransferase
LTRGASWPPGGRLARYLEEIARFGARMNLVGSTDARALAIHVEDSLAAITQLPTGTRVVDLGSGAGFPGIPIALERPDLVVTLVEGRERRVAFLRHAVRTLGLGCEVRRARLEDAPEIRFDYALLRAVARPSRALELGRGWVHERGEVWIWASRRMLEAPGPLAGEIPLSRGGRILRLPAHALPCGTV